MFQTQILAVSYTSPLKGFAVIVINQERYDHRLCRAADLVLEAELCVGSCIYNMWQLALKGGRAFIVWLNFFNWRLSGDKWFHKSNLEVCVAVCCLQIPIFLPVRSGREKKHCLQCRRFPIVLCELLVRVTEVWNEANARVGYRSEGS